MNIELLKELESRGEWARIASLTRADFAELQGNDLARAFVSLAIAHERTATTTREYRQAFHYSNDAANVADHLSFIWTWAQNMTACYAADLGYYAASERAALEFFDGVRRGGHDVDVNTVACVHYALGRASSRLGRHSEAVAHHQMALAVCSDAGFCERIRITLARTWARSGDVKRALDECPTEVHYVSAHKLSAARSLIAARTGDWRKAKAYALMAFQGYQTDSQPVYDAVEMVELLLVLKQASVALRDYTGAFAWWCRAVAFTAPWNVGLLTVVLPPIRGTKGGEIDAAASHRSIAGYHRYGLAGTVG